jgi:hypothetical protein
VLEQVGRGFARQVVRHGFSVPVSALGQTSFQTGAPV